jgi:hypothetical protein
MIPSPSYYWSGLGASQSKPSIFLTGASEVVETYSELHLGMLLAKASPCSVRFGYSSTALDNHLQFVN